MAVAPTAPRLLTLNVTDACRAACVYCHWWRVQTQTPSLAALLRSINEAAEMSVRAIRLSGGEPLLRDDLPELVRAIRARGLTTMVCTAGNCDRARLETLVASGVDLLSFSIDTVHPESFRRLRGYDLEPILDNLASLAARRAQDRFEIIISTVLTRTNVDQLGDLLELARRNDVLLSVTPFQDGGPTAPRSRSRQVAFAVGDKSRIQAAVNQLKAAALRGLRLVNDDLFLDGFADFLVDRRLPAGHVCRAGQAAAIRTSDGFWKLCHSLEAIGDGALHAVWTSEAADRLRERMAELDCPRCWLSCHADARRPVLLRYGRPGLLETLS